MPELETLSIDSLPNTFSKGSSAYAGIKTKIDTTDFDNDFIRVTYDNADEVRKALISVKAYLIKQDRTDLWAYKDNLTIVICSKR